MMPSLSKLFDLFRRQPNFDRAVKEMARRKANATPTGRRSSQHRGKYENVFEEIVARQYERGKETLTDGDISVLINLVKFFVFGTGFNSYNFIVYFLRFLIFRPELWAELHDEQVRVTEMYGAEPDTSEALASKLASMTKLKARLNVCMAENCFPLLFRFALSDFALPGAKGEKDIVIPKGDLVAFSPRMQHANDINMTFGMKKHACPAKAYAENSMMLILSAVIERISITKVISAKRPVSKRLITFPNQPPVIGTFELYGTHA